MMHGSVFPSADWEREVRAVAVFGALRAHEFGQYNFTCFMKGSKVTTLGGMTQEWHCYQVSFVTHLSCVIGGSLFSPAELFTATPIKGPSVCLWPQGILSQVTLSLFFFSLLLEHSWGTDLLGNNLRHIDFCINRYTQCVCKQMHALVCFQRWM